MICLPFGVWIWDMRDIVRGGVDGEIGRCLWYILLWFLLFRFISGMAIRFVFEWSFCAGVISLSKCSNDGGLICLFVLVLWRECLLGEIYVVILPDYLCCI